MAVHSSFSLTDTETKVSAVQVYESILCYQTLKLFNILPISSSFIEQTGKSSLSPGIGYVCCSYLIMSSANKRR
jgi:hypothetical protein